MYTASFPWIEEAELFCTPLLSFESSHWSLHLYYGQDCAHTWEFPLVTKTVGFSTQSQGSTNNLQTTLTLKSNLFCRKKWREVTKPTLSCLSVSFQISTFCSECQQLFLNVTFGLGCLVGPFCILSIFLSGHIWAENQWMKQTISSRQICDMFTFWYFFEIIVE